MRRINDSTESQSPLSLSKNTTIGCFNLTKRFGNVALDRLNLSVAQGEVVGYLGPNGAGKTTTIRILMDLARPTSGGVEIFGVKPRNSGPKLRTRVGYLPGELRLNERLTVSESLRSWIRLRSGAVDPKYLRDLCDRFNLDTTRATVGLSSGNRRKLGLVGAFMAKPELLILDEPTKGLDPLAQSEFFELVDAVRNEGRTVFLSSHILSEVQRMADKIIVLRAGRVIASGTVDEIRKSTKHPFIAWLSSDQAVADMAELRSIPNITDVEVDINQKKISGMVEGSPRALLELLARKPIERLIMPEPDLEQAFLHLYRTEDEQETTPTGY